MAHGLNAKGIKGPAYGSHSTLVRTSASDSWVGSIHSPGKQQLGFADDLSNLK
jgi:hypothetical protein